MDRCLLLPFLRRPAVFAAGLLCALLLGAIPARAAQIFFAIDVTDNSILDWAGAPLLHQDGLDSGVDPQTDILRTYAVRDRPLTAYFFRLTTAGYGDGLALAGANLDCNSNGSYADPGDVYVLFEPEESGIGPVEIGLGDGSQRKTFPNSGEVVENGAYGEYEWAAPIEESVLINSACVTSGAVRVYFSTSTGSADSDETESTLWDIPSAVRLREFHPRPARSPLSHPALLLLTALLAGLAWVRTLEFLRRPSAS